MSKPFVVGQRVSWHGDRGTVEQVGISPNLPVYVEFDNGCTLHFTSGGAVHKKGLPSLKHLRIKKREPLREYWIVKVSSPSCEYAGLSIFGGETSARRFLDQHNITGEVIHVIEVRERKKK